MLEKTKIEVINGFEVKSYVSETLTEEEHQPLIRKWIEENLIPNLIKRTNKYHSSYGLKHMCENDLEFYVSNYDIKYHMAMLGINGINFDNSINYCYPISEKWFKARSKKRREGQCLVFKN